MPMRRTGLVHTRHQSLEIWKSDFAVEFRVAGAVHASFHHRRFLTGLAWDLKAWFALMLPEGVGRHRESYRADKLWLLGLEFKTFVQAFVRLPCQIVRTGRRVVYRLLSWNPYQPIFFRLVDALRC